MILKKGVGDVPAVQDFEPESHAKPAHRGGHSQVGKAPLCACDSGSKDCTDGASPTPFFRIRNLNNKDRLIRAIFSLVLFIAAYLTGSFIALIFALFTLYEAVASWCIIYYLLGKSSCIK